AEHPDGRFQRASELARELEQALASLPGGALPAPLRPPPEAPPAALHQQNLQDEHSAEHQQIPARVNPPASATKPPPPPPGTGPSESLPLLERRAALAGGGDSDLDSVEDSDSDPDVSEPLEEIGQSQVLLLATGIVPEGQRLAEAARRLMALSG